MNNYIIREANIDDIKALQVLRQELIINDKHLSSKEFMLDLNWALSEDGFNDFKANLDNDEEYIYVACLEDEIVGYMTCWVNPKQKWEKYDNFEIGNLYIKEEHRHKGLGTKLLNRAKEISKAKNIIFLKINVLYENEEAQSFYQKNGVYNYAIEQFIEIGKK